MDSPVLQSLKRYDSAQATPTAQLQSNVIKTEFELFHEAPGTASFDVKLKAPDPYEMGLMEGERRAADLHGASTAAMERSLAVLQTHFSESLDAIKQEQASVLTAVLEAALPALARQSFFQEASDMIKALSSSKLGGLITVNCSSEDAPFLAQLFQSSAAPQRFIISESSSTEAKAMNHISFAWEHGGADIDYREAAAAAIRHLLSEFKLESLSSEAVSPPNGI